MDSPSSDTSWTLLSVNSQYGICSKGIRTPLTLKDRRAVWKWQQTMCVHLFLVTEKVGQAGHGYAPASHSHCAGGRLPSLLSPAQSDTVPLTGLYWYRVLRPLTVNGSQTCHIAVPSHHACSKGRNCSINRPSRGAVFSVGTASAEKGILPTLSHSV